MITVLTIIHTPSDESRIKQVLLRANFKTFNSQPTYGSYIKTLQFDADIILMEVPTDLKNHLHFLKLVRCNPGTRKPFVLFGPAFEDNIVRIIMDMGADTYLPRPLNNTALLEALNRLVKTGDKGKPNPVAVQNQLNEEELQKLYNLSIPQPQKLDILKQHISRLLAFPATVASVLQVSNNENSGATDLANVIKTDPSIATELFRIANSVYFSRGGNKQIIDVREAVVRIGFVQTKNIAMGLSVFQIAQNRNFDVGFNHVEFWFHSLATAIISSRLAKISQLVSQEEAFIAGLLHDMGILIFNEYFNKLFISILEKATATGLRFIDCEKAILGFDHNDLMIELFGSWNFPQSICQDAAYFCKSETLTPAFLAEKPLPVIVNTAEVIAKSLHLGREADCCVYAIPAELLSRLKLPYGLQKGFIETIHNELNFFNQSLKMDTRTYPIVNTDSYAGNVNLLCVSFTGEPFSPVVEYLKVKGYNVTVTSDRSTLKEEAAKHHAFLFTDASTTVMGDVRKLSENSELMPFATEDDLSRTETACGAKMLVFDQKNDIDTTVSNQNMIVSKYPVDLRNIDMVLAGLLSETLSETPVNITGTLKPVNENQAANWQNEDKPVLIVHAEKEMRAVLAKLVRQDDMIIKEVGDGKVAISLARMFKKGLRLLIIDLAVPNVPCDKVIREISGIPLHQHMKTIVVMKTMPEKNVLIDLIKSGIKHFYVESVLSEKLPAAVQELLSD